MRENDSAEADDGDGSLRRPQTEPGEEPEFEASNTRLTPHWTRGVLTTLLFVPLPLPDVDPRRDMSGTPLATPLHAVG